MGVHRGEGGRAGGHQRHRSCGNCDLATRHGRCAIFPPPQLPDRYSSDEDRLVRLERQEAESRRKWLIVFAIGCLLLLAYIPLALVGWPGVMVLLAPLGLGMIIGAGILLLLDRASS